MTTDKELPKEETTNKELSKKGPIEKGSSESFDLPNGLDPVGISDKPNLGKLSPSKSSSDKPKRDLMGYVDVIGRIAAVLSIVMYVAYITQISNNLSGHPGSPWQPLAAFFNCMMWTLYGFLKPKKDLPIICANVPGIVLGFTAFITALIH